jgi:hypothetical protein
MPVSRADSQSIARRLRLRSRARLRLLTWRDVWNVRHVGNLAAFGIGHNDSRVVEQKAGCAV